MKIAALIKQVPDTASKIEVKADGTGIEEANLKFVMSPYDEFAVEAALQTRDKSPGSETTVVSLGPQRIVETLRTALAMGMDRAIHIDSGGEAYDAFMVASALSKVIRDKGFDLVFCGKQAIDDDNSQVVQMVAELLDWPHVMIVLDFTLASDAQSATIGRRVGGGGKEIYETRLPLILGCEKGLNTPRYASLPGIMKAKSKPVEKIAGKDLLAGVTALVQFTNFQSPAERAAGKTIAGEPAQQAAQLVRFLREEAKVI